MYLDNPKKLFEDLVNIGTLESYMVVIEEDGYADDLRELVDVVLSVDGSGSRWQVENRDLFDCITLFNDARTFDNIRKVLLKEINSNYVMVCSNCKTTYFFDENPENEEKNSHCEICGDIYTIDEWLKKENIDLYNYLLNRYGSS